MKSENGYAILARFDNYGWTAVTFPKYAVCYYGNSRLDANARVDGSIYGMQRLRTHV